MPLPTLRSQPDSVAAEAWFAAAAGQALLLSETDCVSAALQQRPGQPSLWLGPAAMAFPEMLGAAAAIRLHRAGGAAFCGNLRCSLPLPLASESCGVVMVQHVEDAGSDPRELLEECARVLVPGGWLWLLALNPLAPYRLRWRTHALRAREPVTWRRLLRNAGLVPEAVSQGLGPSWNTVPVPHVQAGVGLRAAFLLRAEKRRLPLTPLRKSRATGWPLGTPA